MRAPPLLLLVPCCLHAMSTALSECQFKAKDGTCYGRELKSRYFFLAEKFTNLNHGSFGTVPKPVRERQNEFFIQQESYPDTWFRKSYYKLLNVSRERLAQELISARVEDVVLVENASSAVNAILKSLGLQRGDKALRLNTAYGMVVETLDYLVETVGIQVIVQNVTFPVLSPDQIVQTVQSALQQHPDVKLCIFSHISSMPAIIEPLVQLVSVVRSHAPQSKILVDGAHAPGQIALQVPSFGVDFYLGNCHKWLYAPKGTAFLWVAPEQQSILEPTVISSSGKHDFVGRFSYTGTRDYTGFASLSAALDFYNFLGGYEQIHEYCHKLAAQAGRYLADAWGTNLLVPETMSGYMMNVILPTHSRAAVVYMQEQLNSTHGIYLVCSSVQRRQSPQENDKDYLKEVHDSIDTDAGAHTLSSEVEQTTSHSPASRLAVPPKGDDCIYFIRVSAQVYLEMEDFRPLASLVPELLKQGQALSNK